MKKISLLVIAFAMVFVSCNDKDKLPEDMNFKQEMRNFVQNLSVYAKDKNPNFVIIPQNGANLVSSTGEEDGTPQTAYINAIDGIGQEDIFYGYDKDDKATPADVTTYLSFFLDMAKNNGDVTILGMDYCSTHSNMDDSYAKNNAKGYISFAADQRNLNNIPDYPAQICDENADTITKLSQAKNVLYFISPDDNYSTAQEFVDAVAATNYDVIVMDYFYNGQEYTDAQIAKLKQKANGGVRMIISYMSIGEAEDYRFYWKSDWKVGNPTWLDKENPNWKGNYKVRYWETDWQNIIFGSNEAYLDKIIAKGFDGTYLDIIDAFEYYEN